MIGLTLERVDIVSLLPGLLSGTWLGGLGSQVVNNLARLGTGKVPGKIDWFGTDRRGKREKAAARRAGGH